MSDVSKLRRTILAALASLFLAKAAPAAAATTPRVALLGDSISAGYGLPASQALPARLSAELARLGRPVQIVRAGVTGETTAGGAARVERGAPGKVDVCVVALGGNDLLLGEDPAKVQANLDRIVRRLKARRVTVVLAGVRVPPLLGGAYARDFNGAFARVAKAHGVIFLPDLLEGVSLNPDLNQRDGIHPNAAGVSRIAQRLAPLVAQGLRAG